jgi:hypothetical protein
MHHEMRQIVVESDLAGLSYITCSKIPIRWTITELNTFKLASCFYEFCRSITSGSEGPTQKSCQSPANTGSGPYPGDMRGSFSTIDTAASPNHARCGIHRAGTLLYCCAPHVTATSAAPHELNRRTPSFSFSGERPPSSRRPPLASSRRAGAASNPGKSYTEMAIVLASSIGCRPNRTRG